MGNTINILDGTNLSQLNVTGITTVAAGSTAAPSISPTGDSDTGIFFPSADTIAFGEGGSEAARIDSSGRFGIGSSGPRAQLEISDGTTNTAGEAVNELYIVGATTADSEGIVTIQSNDALAANKGGSIAFGGRAVSSSTVGANWAIINGFKENASSSNYAGYLSFVTRASGGVFSERARLDSSGRFGIGSTSPDGLLTLPAAASNTPKIRLQSATSDVDVTISSYEDANGTYAAFGANHYLNSSGNDASFDATKRSAYVFVDGRNLGAVTFGTNSSGTATERMRIDSSGRVTMPFQPYARASSSQYTTPTNAIPLNQHNLSRGITISGNRFTVPVTGAYIFGYHHLGNTASGNCNIEIRHNGTQIAGTRTQDTNASNDSFGTQTVKELSANDYIEFWVLTGTIHGNQDYNSMWIWLLG